MGGYLFGGQVANVFCEQRSFGPDIILDYLQVRPRLHLFLAIKRHPTLLALGVMQGLVNANQGSNNLEVNTPD